MSQRNEQRYAMSSDTSHRSNQRRTFSVAARTGDSPTTPPDSSSWASAGPDLLRQSSETLAGRIAYYGLPPLNVGETGTDAMGKLWSRGGFSSSFLAPDDTRGLVWRNAFIRTFLEGDLL